MPVIDFSEIAEANKSTGMQDTFEARNEGEEKLLSTQGGKLSSEALMEYTMDEQLFMPVNDLISS